VARARGARQEEGEKMSELAMVVTEIKRRIDLYDDRIEGCDGDEWIAYNAIIAQLHDLAGWIIEQRKR
jgi:hypothetical protein